MNHFKQIIFAVMAISQFALAQPTDTQWTKVADSVEWKARDSQGEVTFNDHMWVFGGWHSSYETPPRDVWRSSDGNEWQLVTDNAPWTHSDLPMSVTFNNRMWMMGGWYNGRLEDRSASNQVWSSVDGAEWKLEAGHASWSPRCAAAIVTFHGRMWILGGTTSYYYGDSTNLLNDVWSSEDGQNWTLETADAAWKPRAYHQAVVLNNKIYVMGGGNYDPEYWGHNDVWSTEDGVLWQLETSEAPWHDRIWFSSFVYRDQMWVTGGWSNFPYTNWPDTWYSKDGKKWTELKTIGPRWKERHEHSTFVFRDKIWIAGGMTPPLVNDIWSLELPEDWGK